MQAGVLRRREQGEILKAIVVPLFVDMVNVLFGRKWSPKVLRHNEAMLKDVPLGIHHRLVVPNPNHNVTVFHVAPALPGGMGRPLASAPLQFVVALLRAHRRFVLKKGRCAGDLVAANLAGNRHNLAPAFPKAGRATKTSTAICQSRRLGEKVRSAAFALTGNRHETSIYGSTAITFGPAPGGK